jgi:chromosome segregation ATPase
MANDDPNEQPTQKLTAFETMVLARFDDLTANLARSQRETNERFEKLESKALDTKPIWERALAEILEVKGDVAGLKGDVAGLKGDVAGLKDDVAGLKDDVAEVKDRLQRVEGSLGILTEDLVKVRADLQGFNRRIMALEKA